MSVSDLDGALTGEDTSNLEWIDSRYAEARPHFRTLERPGVSGPELATARNEIVRVYDSIGKRLQKICATEQNRLSVYSFQQPRAVHGEASRLIAKLRDETTPHEEFVYYIQRAYELLFALAFPADESIKQYRLVRTPVDFPEQNYAVHKLPNLDARLNNTVMCVLLRGSLLPSMIMAKEIEEYATSELTVPFALFRIHRNDDRKGSNMEYVLDLEASYFDPAALDGKDLIFADPMQATGGSLVTILKYLEFVGVRPRSVLCCTVISALKGALQLLRSSQVSRIATLWMDPVLNEKAYILPGLGDAGDRLNGRDTKGKARNIIQLIADYGSNICNLYRDQVREVERTVLKWRG